MYSVTIETTFSATHRVQYPDGSLEPVHGHDWQVCVHFQRSSLDDHGMVIDFIEAQSILKSIVTPLHHADLNNLEAFQHTNPTAEIVAKYIFDRCHEKCPDTLQRVEITEAPGCVAAYQRTNHADV